MGRGLSPRQRRILTEAARRPGGVYYIDLHIACFGWRPFAGVPRERFLAFCDALGAGELRARPRRWSA